MSREPGRKQTLARAALAGLMAVLAAGPGLAQAAILAGDKALQPFDEWQVLTLPEKPPADFIVAAPDTLIVEADGAVAFLYAEVTVKPGAQLTWRWRVDRGIAPSAQDRVGQDDRPLAIHLWFPPPEAERSLFDRLGGLFGYPSIGRVMTYVWGGERERGTVFDHPHFDEGRLTVLRGAEAGLGTWYEERIDFIADYRDAFGEDPPQRLYIAISADTDDMGGMSLAKIKHLRWSLEDRASLQPSLQQGQPLELWAGRP